jgi:formate dehydrogenase
MRPRRLRVAENRAGLQNVGALAVECRFNPNKEHEMAKIVCVLFDDPIDGYPPAYARDDIPAIDRYPGGQTAPTPKAIGFKPGTLLGSVSGELGLRAYLEGLGHQFVVTSDKDGPNSRFEHELADAE